VAGFILGATVAAAAGLEINLGTDREVSVGELAERIAALVGTHIRVVQDPARMRPEQSEVMRLHADASLAGRVLGWHPAVTLEAGLAETVAWIRAHPELYRPGTYEV